MIATPGDFELRNTKSIVMHDNSREFWSGATSFFRSLRWGLSRNERNLDRREGQTKKAAIKGWQLLYDLRASTGRTLEVVRFDMTANCLLTERLGPAGINLRTFSSSARPVEILYERLYSCESASWRLPDQEPLLPVRTGRLQFPELAWWPEVLGIVLRSFAEYYAADGYVHGGRWTCEETFLRTLNWA